MAKSIFKKEENIFLEENTPLKERVEKLKKENTLLREKLKKISMLIDVIKVEF